MVPEREPDAGSKMYDERQRPFQKLLGEYLFATVRRARVDVGVGKTPEVEVG